MKIGVDIGGTTIHIGVVEGDKLISNVTYPSFDRNDTMEQTLGYLTGILENHVNERTSSIGIGVPSVVDIEKGIVYNTANIPSWKEVHLKAVLEGHFGIPVMVNNDANCFAIGAARSVNAGDDEIVAAVTLGTGVGIGLVVNGKIVNGANTGLGEITWIPYKGKTLEDWCGKNFFVDQGIRPVELYRKAEEGAEDAIRIFSEYGHELAFLMAIVMGAYDPHRVVFGGGLSNNHKYFEKAMMDGLRELFPFPASVSTIRIEYLTQSETAVIGAAGL